MHRMPDQEDINSSNLPKRPLLAMAPCCWCLLLLTLSYGTSSALEQNVSPDGPQQSPSASVAAAPASPSSSASSFVLADPNSPSAQSAYSPPAEPSPILPASSQSAAGDNGAFAASPGDFAAPVAAQSSDLAPVADAQQAKQSPMMTSAAGTAPNGGYGAMMSASPPAAVTGGGTAMDDPLAQSMNDAPPSQDTELTSPAKRRQQFNQYAVPAVPMPEPALLAGIGGAVPAVGTCPGGASLPIECDPKRPWPQCPPQSYCYATNTVDIGPYFCCPIWSTYGAAWRPATPFYNYAPPPPPNWPEPMRMASYGGSVRKERKEQRFDDDGGPLMTQEEQRKILQVMNDWVERQTESRGPPPPAPPPANATTTTKPAAEGGPSTDRAPAKKL